MGIPHAGTDRERDASGSGGTEKEDPMSVINNPTRLTVENVAFETITVDIYRDIHKGIRAELFAVTASAGSVDPGDRESLTGLAGRVRDLAALLESHARHEDDFFQPLVEVHTPVLAEVIARDHEHLDAQIGALEVLAERAADSARVERRLAAHRLYLGLASFTSEYLAHQGLEELEVAPALAASVGEDELAAVEAELIASIPPDEMMSSLAVMIPAMNVDDRAGLLGGMKAGAPPEAFAAVWNLAERVLAPADAATLEARISAS